MRSVFGVLLTICSCLWVTNTQATVKVDIDLTHQSMNVSSDSGGSYTWPVSTARSGYVTPRGSFSPYSLEKMHYSHKYHMSPMPYSIFFAGGYAIHGTYSVAQLGRPASHGCIRLSPGHAAELFRMVKAEGAAISISGTPPQSTMFAEDRHRHAEPRTYAAHRRSHDYDYARVQQPRGGDYYYYGGSRPEGGEPLAYSRYRYAPSTVRTWQADPYYHW